MSKQIDALKLALEALEKIASSDYRGNRSNESVIAFKTLTAIKEALANVATEDTSKERVDEMQKQRHEQEPVAWLHWLHWPVRLFLNKDEAMMELDRLNREYPVDKDARQMKPLYTTPPQRTWVGLTDEEVDECYYWKDRQWTTDELVRHVEAKLKEKNT